MSTIATHAHESEGGRPSVMHRVKSAFQERRTDRAYARAQARGRALAGKLYDEGSLTDDAPRRVVRLSK